MPKARSPTVVLQLDFLETHEWQGALIAAGKPRPFKGHCRKPRPSFHREARRRGAPVFLGSIGNPEVHGPSRRILRVAGLSTAVRESRLLRRKPRLNKRDGPDLRTHTFMFALGFVRRSHGIFRGTYDRILANNGGRKIPAFPVISRKVPSHMFRVACERALYTMVPRNTSRRAVQIVPPTSLPQGPVRIGASR